MQANGALIDTENGADAIEGSVDYSAM